MADDSDATAHGLRQSVEDAFSRVSELAQTLGTDHSQTLKSRADLGSLLLSVGLAGEAVTVFDELLVDLRRRPNEPEETIASVRAQFAEALSRNGSAREALRQWQLVLGERTRRLGANHPDTLSAVLGVAAAKRDSGNIRDAITMYESVWRIRVRTLGAEHPDTLAARDARVQAMRKQINNDVAFRRRYGDPVGFGYSTFSGDTSGFEAPPETEPTQFPDDSDATPEVSLRALGGAPNRRRSRTKISLTPQAPPRADRPATTHSVKPVPHSGNEGMGHPPWMTALLASPTYELQKSRAGRRQPGDDTVLSVLGALAGHDNRLTRTALADVTGCSRDSLELVLAAVRRIVNVEGYPVIYDDPDGSAVRLDFDLMMEQFDIRSGL